DKAPYGRTRSRVEPADQAGRCTRRAIRRSTQRADAERGIHVGAWMPPLLICRLRQLQGVCSRIKNNNGLARAWACWACPGFDLRLHLHGLSPFFACVVSPVTSA